MALESVLCYRMPCRNPTLLLDNSNRNFLGNSSFSREKLTRTRDVCSLKMIQTSLAQNGLYRACSFEQKRECLQLEDCEYPISKSLGPIKSSEDHQRSIESYLDKLDSETEQQNGNISQLKSLHAYLGSLNEDAKTNNKKQLDFAQDSVNKEASDGRMKTFVGPKRKRKEILSSESMASSEDDESFNLYIVSGLTSIDIAVFLFEVASPIKNSEYNLYSLPLLYGAKVNELILVGEWWRLITPMFLHSGVFHVALSSWVLLDFGPRVCGAYGSFTFFFVCLLGGISGNLLSFLHSPEATVGGSGPVFAIIGAWLIYQLQNKDMVCKQVSKKMFQKAAIATTLSFGLANFGLIDSWTYLGAAITGISYGFLTCPILLNDPISKVKREEGITIARQYHNPYKSFGVFVLFVLVFSSMLYLMDPPLDTPQLEGLLEMPQLENLLEMVE